MPQAVEYALHLRATSRAASGTGSGAGSGPQQVLTRREREVATLIADGLSNRQIAERLVLSPRTVDGHVEHVLVKLGFTSRTQVAAWVAGQHAGDPRPA